MEMDSGYEPTRYVKPSKRVAPQKADHMHEYVLPFAMLKVRCFDGTISEERYKFSLPLSCVICGHSPSRRGSKKNVVEVEVSPQEYRRLKG